MTHKLTKTLSLLVAVIIALTCFSACGNKEASSEGVGSPVKLNGDKIYPVECEDTLTFWFSGTAVWNQDFENFGETPLGKEIAKKTGIKIEYIHPSMGQGNEQFQILLASDDLPDIVNNKWYSFAGGPDEAINQEYIYELSDIIDKYCPAYKKLLKDNPDWDKSVKTDAHNYYAFNYFRGKDPITSTVWGPIVRGDLLREAGLDIPVTMEDWDEMLTVFRDKYGVEKPYIGRLSYLGQTFYPAYGGFSGWYQDNGVVKYGEAQPQYKDFLKKMNEWYETGLLDYDFAVFDATKFDSDVLNSKGASFSGYSGSTISALLEAAKDYESFDLIGVPYPVLNEADGVAEYSRVNQEADITGVSTAISRKCKNVELAARFLDWGFTEEGDTVYNFGIEGESFNWVDKDGEKYPEYTDLVLNNPEGRTMSDILHKYTRAAESNVPMVLDSRHTRQFASFQQQKDAMQEWTKTNMKEHNHLLPAIYLTSDDADVDADIMAAVKTYVDEMTIKFITGREPLDNFDKYLEQLDKFGLQTCVEFRQKALERYNKR